MPTLQFKGKAIIWNHHLSVPYHSLEAIPDFGYKPENAHGNIIVEGDNLLGLKALLPLYSGRVKCIYIDPPYNTGNEGWAYNDNVNSPMIREWLGREVGKDDLTRHDKWLCMIVPRLRLLRELLSDDGVILISIDDNEIAHLRCVCDEIFGPENFVNVFAWQSRTSMQNDTDISVNHEYIVVYAKSRRKEDRRLKETNYSTWFHSGSFAYYPLPLDPDKFSNPDNDPRGSWKQDPFDAPGIRENLTYPITNPNTGEIYWPPEGRHWRTEEETYQRYVEDGRILFGKTGEARPYLKVFYEEKKLFGEVDTTWFPGNERGTVTEATKDLMGLFESKNVFEYSKPVNLLIQLLRLTTRGGDIILDSFAGSGTTAHAVLEMNRADQQNRRFILLQMTEATAAEPDKNICRDITRERVRRAIEKNGYESGFQYLRVGSSMDADNLLSGDLPAIEPFLQYLFFVCTGHTDAQPIEQLSEDLFFAGTNAGINIYAIYSQDIEKLSRLALNLDIAQPISHHAGGRRKIVYAPACFLDEDYLQANQIEFVNIPYGLFGRGVQQE